MTSANEIKKIAIIGGGAAGLCAAKHLLSSTQGFELRPVIFEQRSTVGGTWVYEDVVESAKGDVVESANENVFSSIYKNLRSNLPKQLMNFPDFPFADEIPSFMHHSDVRKYLENYAKHFELQQYIRFQTKVVDIEPLSDEKRPLSGEPQPHFEQKGNILVGGTQWCVTSEQLTNGEKKKMVFDAVVICNGHYSVPYVPDIAGLKNFRNTIMHSHYYRDPEQYAGKTALVLGFGPSGRDIALELSRTCAKVYLSHRKDRCLSKLPDNLTELPGMSHVTEVGNFVFTNGEVVEVDLFLMCTGYKVDLPFVNKKFPINIEAERVVKGLYNHLFFIKNPSLCIVGLPWQTIPFPIMHQQSAYIASIYSGRKQLPSKADMKLETESEEKEYMLSNQSPQDFHKMGMKQFPYNDTLALLSGCERNPSYMEKLYAYVSFARTDMMNYKNLEFRLVNNEEFEVVD